MLKVPVAGKVKTRLTPPLKKEDAARLYKCFIQDIFSRISTLNGIDIIAAYTPKNVAERIKRIVPANTTLIPQKGNDLGERLSNLFSGLFSAGYKKIAVIGTDSPDLPVEYIKKSFSSLNKNTSIVIGPSRDGGYYLIAMSRYSEEVFKDIPWSTNTVFKKTLEKAKKAGLLPALLPEWYDVDETDGLKTLRENMRLHYPAAKTSKFLEKISHLF
ncbi:MAG: TIGR04282 family arsenosugar biosynthesis glycosyltransferase [Deltaproteobacteria bacterium]